MQQQLAETVKQMVRTRAISSGVLRGYNAKNVTDNTGASLEVTQATMNGVQQNIWPGCIQEFSSAPIIQLLTVELARDWL
jgi:hypothetical protein